MDVETEGSADSITVYAMGMGGVVLGGVRVPLRECRAVPDVGGAGVAGWSVPPCAVVIQEAGVLAYVLVVLPDGARVGCTPKDIGVEPCEVGVGAVLSITDMLVRQPPRARVLIA